jgi:hypothetical protein
VLSKCCDVFQIQTVARDEKLYNPFSQPQHIVVGQFSAHLIAGEGNVHNLSIANPLKIVNNRFCSLLFVDPLKFQEHIGINVASLRIKTGAFP